MKPARRPILVAVAVAALTATGLLASGCGAGAGAGPAPSPGVSASTAPPPPADPVVGSCHSLTVREATDPVDTGDPVPCREPHTSVTTKVGQIDAVVDGHLLAVDSRTVRSRIADACPEDPGSFLGGDRTAQRLSRFEVVWFGPSLEQADAGANWYRCDVVAVRAGTSLLTLPRNLEGILDRNGALDRFGTCGTAAPGRRGFARVVCSEEHSWRAVDVVAFPTGTRHLAEDAAAAGDAACKDVAAERADGDLKYTWSFEWPTRAEWASGRRYGYCWVPES